ncbi:hypothetical protein COO91_00814 [Nostoc flagelliforme CCNUN1]|uniref:Uncharacterized protein n=1 Tax=Nostoc flagelliforme CCNUN1 TaxID=2038116 RepID=A0A2K8SI00_9NOSO|nr:hypothetical protein COO91_00814 [Nostoc flagelliforme CCNUN1]
MQKWDAPTVFLTKVRYRLWELLTQVASYQKVPLLKYKILLLGIYQYLKMDFLYQYDTVYGH